MKIIGGFFGLHLPDAVTANSFLSLWELPVLSHGLFSNGRSALHHLLAVCAPKCLWLPAYCCVSLAQAADMAGTPVHFYPILPNLSPDVDYLQRHLKAGDAVLAIDYFGRNPDERFLRCVRSLTDVLWIEDRAQAMRPSATAWGDYVLYSPRKLVGVPDGGILVSMKKPLSPASPAWNRDMHFVDAALARYEDREEGYNDIWYAYSRQYENTMEVSALSMSRLSQHILRITDPAPLMAARHANYRQLMGMLSDIALLPAHDDSFVPFGFPICVPQRQTLLEALYHERIFAACHWPELPSDPSVFAAEHHLNAQLVTLPVDHRYAKEDMQRIIACVQRALS